MLSAVRTYFVKDRLGDLTLEDIDSYIIERKVIESENVHYHSSSNRLVP